MSNRDRRRCFAACLARRDCLTWKGREGALSAGEAVETKHLATRENGRRATRTAGLFVKVFFQGLSRPCWLTDWLSGRADERDSFASPGDCWKRAADSQGEALSAAAGVSQRGGLRIPLQSPPKARERML